MNLVVDTVASDTVPEAVILVKDIGGKLVLPLAKPSGNLQLIFFPHSINRLTSL